MMRPEMYTHTLDPLLFPFLIAGTELKAPVCTFQEEQALPDLLVWEGLRQEIQVRLLTVH